jgi:hypothetical protein
VGKVRMEHSLMLTYEPRFLSIGRGELDDSIAVDHLNIHEHPFHPERSGKIQQQRWRNHSFENAKINKTNDTRFVIVLLAFSPSERHRAALYGNIKPFMTFVAPAALLRHNSYFKVIFPFHHHHWASQTIMFALKAQIKRREKTSSLLIALIKTFNKGVGRCFLCGSHVCSSNNRKKVVFGEKRKRKFMKILINELWNIVESFAVVKQKMEGKKTSRSCGEEKRTSKQYLQHTRARADERYVFL